MRKIILSILFLLFVPALSFALPAIQFNETSFDFGEARQGDRVEHIFEFGNKGDQDLVIEKLTST